MSDHPEASAPSCPPCGAPLPLDFASAELTCRHCGASLRVDERLRAAMLKYVGDVAAAAKRELEARWTGTFYLQNEKAATSFVFGAVGIAIALTGALMAWILTRAFQTELALPYFAVLVIAWTISLAAFIRGYAVMFALPTPKELAAVRAMRCARCGAVSTASAGAPVSRCKHCEGALLVPSELALSLLGETRERAGASVAREEDALGRAVSAGDRHIPAALTLVFTSVPLAVFAVIYFGRIGGPSVTMGTMWLTFGALFAAAFVVMWRATSRASEAKRAFDAHIDALAKRIAMGAQR